MNPKFWGPHIWFTWHCIASVYPDNPTNVDMNNMSNFIHNLFANLPCETCKQHGITVLLNGYKAKNKSEVSLPPLGYSVLKNRKTYFRYVYDFHDLVNRVKKLDQGEKRTISPKYEYVLAFYNASLINPIK